LPAADLRRVAVGQRAQAHQLQQRVHTLADGGLVHARQLQRQRHVVEHGARRQQVEVLEHHADVAARRAQPGVVQLRQIAPGHDHLALGGPVEQVDGAHQLLLPAPLRPMMPNTSPAWMCRLTSCSACTGPWGPR
jgi:hypothetical protein